MICAKVIINLIRLAEVEFIYKACLCVDLPGKGRVCGSLCSAPAPMWSPKWSGTSVHTGNSPPQSAAAPDTALRTHRSGSWTSPACPDSPSPEESPFGPCWALWSRPAAATLPPGRPDRAAPARTSGECERRTGPRNTRRWWYRPRFYSEPAGLWLACQVFPTRWRGRATPSSRWLHCPIWEQQPRTRWW